MAAILLGSIVIRENAVDSLAMTASISIVIMPSKGELDNKRSGNSYAQTCGCHVPLCPIIIVLSGAGAVLWWLVVWDGMAGGGGDKPEGKRGLSVPIKGLDCEAGESFYGPVP